MRFSSRSRCIHPKQFSKQVPRRGRTLLRLETLEQRQLLALLGVTPEYPLMVYDYDGTVTYDAATDAFDVKGTPIALQLTDSSTPTFVSGDAGLEIHIRVGESGNLMGGVDGDDLVLTGELDIDGDFTPDVSGVLLTGEIAAFGFQGEGSSTDQFDFRFRATGGALRDEFEFFDGKDIGVLVDSESSTFTGSFMDSFQGGAKGTIGTLEALQPPAGVDIEKYVKQGCAAEGLTPGFWKQCQHLKYWTDYHTSDSYNEVFGVNDSAGLTLLEALGRGGGGANALGRQAVAALLNAANPNVNYAFTESQIIAMVRQAYATGDFETVKNQLAAENERGADLNDECSPCPTGYGDDADEPTGPAFRAGQRVQFTYVVANTGEIPLADITVVDDNGTPQTSDDFSPSPILAGGFNVGDSNQDGLLDVGETWLYSHTITITCCTPNGQHVNDATVTGNPVDGQSQVSDHDVAYWYVGCPATASLGNFVWNDADRDGKQDTGEEGLAGVTVKLLDSWGRTLRTTVTDASGAYQFTNLPAGGYKVKVLAPNGFVFSPQYRGDTADNDSNVNPNSGITDSIWLDYGEVDNTIDAGLYRKSTCGAPNPWNFHWNGARYQQYLDCIFGGEGGRRGTHRW